MVWTVNLGDSLSQFTSLFLIWEDEIIVSHGIFVSTKWVYSVDFMYLLYYFLLEQTTKPRSWSLLYLIWNVEVEQKFKIRARALRSPYFSFLPGYFFHTTRFFIAFEKQAGKFYWMVIATLWLDITYTHIYTHMCMCVCIDTHTFIYLCICTSICVCVWYSLLLNCFGKMAPLCCFQIPVDISRMPMDEYSRRELLLFFPWEFSVIFLEYAEASPTAVLLL